MGSEDCESLVGISDSGLESSDDGGLGEGVREVFEGDVGAEWRVFDYLPFVQDLSILGYIQ